MNPVRYTLLSLSLLGCSSEPIDRGEKVTGSAAAVAGLPHNREAGRFEVENCCTFQLGPYARAKQLPGIDSVVHNVSGPGYTLRVIFGPYDGAQPQSGYGLVGKRMIDRIELAAFRWTDRNRKPPEGPRLWLAQVGGGRIEGVNHTAWGLRIMGDCKAPAACRASAALVETIRF